MNESVSETATREGRIDAAIAEFLIAKQDGRPFDRDAWLTRHAEFVDELREFVTDEEQVAGILAPIHVAAETITHADRDGSTESLSGPRGLAGPLTLPATVGDYDLLEEIARGGMGVVFKARQKSLNRIVALKMVLGSRLASGKDIERFQREAEAAAGLDHPNIVPIYEVGAIDGLPFFSMKLIEGGSLNDRRAEFHDNPRRTAELMATVARAVHHAHQRGILHRDLKPSNVLLDANAEPHVADFGLAKRIEVEASPDWASPGCEPGDNNTRTGAVVGTPAYMAPEQARGQSKQLTTAADVYGLGAVLYELLAGQPPFRAGSPAETLLLVLNQEPIRPSQVRTGIPRDLETICLKCLEKEPARRYGSAEALADDIDSWLKGEPILARPIGRVERMVKWARRNKAAAGLVGVTLILPVIAAAGLFVANAVIRKEKYAAEQAYDREKVALVREKNTSESLAETLAREKDTSGKLGKSLKRQQRTHYFSSIHLIDREWLTGHLEAARELLRECPEDLRGWEWNYLDRLCHAERLTFRWKTEAIDSVAFSPDGKQLLISSGNVSIGKVGEVKTWDAQTGRELATMDGKAGQFFNAVYSPDGRLIAAPSKDKMVRVWEAASGRLLHTLAPKKSWTIDACFNRDGSRLAVTVDGRGIVVFDTATGNEMVTHLAGGGGYVMTVAYSLDDRYLVSGGPGKDVVVRDLTAGTEQKLTGHQSRVNVIAFSRDGKRLASGGDDGQVKIWDVGTWKEVRTIAGHKRAVFRIVFSPDGRRLLSAGGSYGVGGRAEIKLWNVATGNELYDFRGHPGGGIGAAFSPDGRRVATASSDGTVKIWDLSRCCEAVAAGHQGGTFLYRGLAVTFTNDSEHAFAIDGDDGARLWDAVTGEEAAVLGGFKKTIAGPNGQVSTLAGQQAIETAASGDGRFLVAGGGGMIRVWDAATRRELHTIWAFRAQANGKATWYGEVTCLALSRDGNRIFAFGNDRDEKYRNLPALRVFETATGQEILHFADPPVAVANLAVSPDGSHVIGAVAGEVWVWDSKTGDRVRKWSADSGGVRWVICRPDGLELATAGADGTVRTWDVETGQELLRLKSQAGTLYTLAYHPDGSRLASGGGDGTVQLWDLKSGHEALALRGHPGMVAGLAFSPNGHRLVAMTANGLVSIWDATPRPKADIGNQTISRP